MKLVPVSTDDLTLFESMFCDPKHMADLGGVQPREKVRISNKIHTIIHIEYISKLRFQAY